MTSTTDNRPSGLLSTAAAAARLTFVPQTLRRWAVTGGTAPWSQRIGAGEEAQHLQRAAVQAANRQDQRCAKLVSGNVEGA